MFKKGQSGNPLGRKPGSANLLTREIKKVLKSNGGEPAREFAQKLVALAQNGNTQAAKLILDRVDGRVRTAEEIAKADGAPERMTPEQRRERLRDLLRQPELKSIAEEVLLEDMAKAAPEKLQ